MKKVFLSLLIVAFAFSANAQEKGKIRVGFNGGLALPNLGAGLNGDLDIRYNIMDNLNAGVKFTGGMLVKDLTEDVANGTASATAGVISSTLVTSDYYFSKGTSIFAPYLGGGLGFYKVMNIGITASGSTTPTPPSDYSAFTPESKFGGLIRGGFELGHFRMGLEYYLAPSSNVIDMTSMTASGTTANSYLSISLGFYLGGGHWKK